MSSSSSTSAGSTASVTGTAGTVCVYPARPCRGDVERAGGPGDPGRRPGTVEELQVMADGPYAVDGVEDAGQGTEAAAAFLERLAAVAAVHPVVALPYGDVDADSLQAAGLADVVIRSLPGSRRAPRRTRCPRTAQAGAEPTFPPADPTGHGSPRDGAGRHRRRGAHPRRRPRRRAAHRRRLGRGRDPAARDPADPPGRGRGPGRPGQRGAHRRRGGGRALRQPRDGPHHGEHRLRAGRGTGGRPDARGHRRHGRAGGRRARAWPNSATWPSSPSSACRRPPAASRPCSSPRPGTCRPAPRAPAR